MAQDNVNGVESTDIIDFIPFSQVPANKKVTYASFACDHRPLKTEPWRVRIIVGGDKLLYESDAGSPAANMLETKILLNSVISDAKNGARFCSMDLKDMFLHTPMLSPEYMKVHYRYFPQDIRTTYNLNDIVHSDGYIYIKIKKRMYGLKQAAILAYEFLSKLLRQADYIPITGALGLWKHKTRPTVLCLCVDDFGVKYYSKNDLQHLHQAISQQYTCKIDEKGNNFLGFTLDWNYDKGYVDVSMPNYVKEALVKLQYKPKQVPQYSPHKYISTNWTCKGNQ